MSAQLTEALTGLGISLLPSDWVDAIVDGNFCEPADDWPLDEAMLGEAAHFWSQLREAFQPFIAAAASDATTTTSVWTALVDNEVRVQALLAALHFSIGNVTENPDAGVAAACVYMTMLRLPGCGAHKTVNPMLYRAATALVARCEAAATTSKGKRKATAAGSTTSRRGRSTRAKVQASYGEDSDEDEEDEDEDEEDAEDDEDYGGRRKRKAAAPSKSAKRDAGASNGANSGAAAKHLQRQLLEDFVRVLASFPLLADPESVTFAAQTLVDVITRAGSLPAMPSQPLADLPLETMTDGSLVALTGLDTLARAGSEENQGPCRAVLRPLLATVLMTWAGVAPSITKAMLTLRDGCLELVRRLLAEKVCPTVTRTFVQHLCVNAVDRAHYRAPTAEAVATLVLGAPTTEDMAGMLAWIKKYSRNQKVSYRAFSLHISLALLQRFADFPADSDLRQTSASLLVAIVTGRLQDKSPSVRAHALECLADLLDLAAAQQEMQAALSATLEEQGGSTLMDLLARRSKDEKSGVRKAAVAALHRALSLPAAFPPSAQHFQDVADRCADPAVSVRKLAVGVISDLLRLHPANGLLHTLWLQAVMPLVLDAEDTVRSKCMEEMEDMLLRGVQGLGASADAEGLAWALLRLVDETQDFRRYLRRACLAWARGGQLTPPLFAALMSKVQQPANTGGWTLLSEMAVCAPASTDPQPVLQAWQLVKGEDDPSSQAVLGHILVILGSAAAKVPAASAHALSQELTTMLLAFELPAMLVATALQTLAQLEAVHGVQTGGMDVQELAGKLLDRCTRRLTAHTLCEGGVDGGVEGGVKGGAENAAAAPLADEHAAILLFTLGEASIMAPGKVTERVVLAVQALATGVAGQGAAVAAVSPAVKAHAFLALGKLCLQDEDLAQKCLPSMSRELEEGPDPAVRNNVVIILADLCIRYTSIVERFLPSVSARLRDEAPLVRRQTLTLLTRLLSEDYIKLRGVLFFRLLSTLVDSDASVRNLAKFCLLTLLPAKHRGQGHSMFYSHFLESLFVLNDYRSHNVYNQLGQSAQEATMFSLAGAAQRRERHILYRTMLENCSDLDKLNITQQLNQEILGAVVDGTLKLTAALEPVVRDALNILASKEIKLSQGRAGGDDEDLDMSQAESQASQAAAKAKSSFISKVVKKNTVENIIPIIIALKAQLEKQHSPLQSDLMLYLRETLKDYKEEVADILAADRQLSNEIMYDLAKFEQQQQGAGANGSPARAVAAASPGLVTAFMSPAPGGNGRTPLATTPLLCSPLLASGGGTPKFRPPRSVPRRSMSVAAAVTRKNFLQGKAAAGGAAAGAASPMAWVRTPSSSSQARNTSNAVDDIITLPSPAAAADAPAEPWNVAVPEMRREASSSSSNRKRRGAEDDEEEETDPLDGLAGESEGESEENRVPVQQVQKKRAASKRVSAAASAAASNEPTPVRRSRRAAKS